jgi:hypothetical protein
MATVRVCNHVGCTYLQDSDIRVLSDEAVPSKCREIIATAKGDLCMSMPTIPDICPEICITREDAVNLLLTSIALEEVGLADLIEAETKKIKFVLGDDDYNEPSTKDILRINHSVNQTIKNIIKLQMLLQFKLENVIEIIGTETCSTLCTTTCTTTHTTTSTTTSTTTTGCTTSKCTPKPQNPCLMQDKETEERLAVHGHGGILNTTDSFFGGTAFLKTELHPDSNSKVTNSIRYYAEKGRIMEVFTAIPDSIMVMRTGDRKDEYEICGTGAISKTNCGQSEGTAIGSFTLLLRTADKGHGIDSFRMSIIPEKRRELNHDSGMVTMNEATLTTKD